MTNFIQSILDRMLEDFIPEPDSKVLEYLIVKNKFTSYLIQNVLYYQSKNRSYYYPFLDNLKCLAESDLVVSQNMQQKLFDLKVQEVNKSLIRNPNLLPKFFVELFAEYYQYLPSGFQYENPATQELYEKMKVLV